MANTNDPDELAKWEFLLGAPMRDAFGNENTGNEQLRQIAKRLREVASLSAFPDWTFASLCLSLSRDGIRYETDTKRVGREQIDGYTDPYVSPLEPYRRGTDDCDAKARLFVALCLAGGLQATMVPRWRGGRLVHVYGRVNVLSPAEHSPRWHTAETILRRARLGDVAEQVPKESDTGKWSM
jgi:transglutaminase-like putative cysteine protease